jgi:hypothetical protein
MKFVGKKKKPSGEISIPIIVQWQSDLRNMIFSEMFNPLRGCGEIASLYSPDLHPGLLKVEAFLGFSMGRTIQPV